MNGFEDFILRYAPVALFIAVLIYLFDIMVGRLLDRATRRREAIRSEAEKHMDEYLKELGR
jgi:hypothetical protein